jgi:hypothetical protein
MKEVRALLGRSVRGPPPTLIPPDTEEKIRGGDGGAEGGGESWRVLEQPFHRVLVRECRSLSLASGPCDVVEVKWQTRDAAAHGDHDGCVRFPRDVFMASTTDMEWLFSPWECPFSLSLRGDLRPLKHNVLRHPVGRPEIIGQQVGAGVWDSCQTVARKFAEAADASTCVEMHTVSRLRRLRALPPTRERMEEVGRTAVAWLSCVRTSYAAGGTSTIEQVLRQRHERMRCVFYVCVVCVC